MREAFGDNLPHEKTISNWLSVVDGSPGFTKEAVGAGQAKVKAFKEENGDKDLFVNLVVDEMAIMQGTEKVGNQVIGYACNGDLDEEYTDDSPKAKEAWVFMAVCMNQRWKIPFGYFLIKGLDGTQRATLLDKGLRFFYDSGAVVTSLTFDGNYVNFIMCEKLGACFDPDNLKPHFQHPVTNTRVYTILDNAHAIKNVRNTLSTHVLINLLGGEIKF